MIPSTTDIFGRLDWLTKQFKYLSGLVSALEAGGGGGGVTPTLQQVTTAGATTADTIEINVGDITNQLSYANIVLLYNDGTNNTVINIAAALNDPNINIVNVDKFKSQLTAYGILFDNFDNYPNLALRLYTEVFNNSIEIGDTARENFINVFGQANNERIYFQAKTSKYNFKGVPTYFDNAAALADGLIVGDIYRRTAGGDSDSLCIVH